MISAIMPALDSACNDLCYIASAVLRVIRSVSYCREDSLAQMRNRQV